MWRLLTAICLHINRKARTACDFHFIVVYRGFLKGTAGSHVHCKSGNNSETVKDRNAVNTVH